MAVYFTVNNLPFCLQCRRNNIYLILIVKRTIVKSNGLNTVLEPLIVELINLLCEGIEISEAPHLSDVKARCVALCCDNKAAHEIFGLSQSFNCGPICRYCDATYEEIQEFFHSSSYTERTEESLNRNLLEVKEKNGILRQHAFDGVIGFNITKCCPPDIMHDIAEGVILKHLEPMLTNLLDSCKKVEKFNTGIKNLEWSDDSVNEVQFKKIKLKGTSYQVNIH